MDHFVLFGDGEDDKKECSHNKDEGNAKTEGQTNEDEIQGLAVPPCVVVVKWQKQFNEIPLIL